MALFIYPLSPVTVSTGDLATEVTLAAVQTAAEAVEVATEAIQASVANIEAEDFATETTLASLEAKDFATQTTLASLEAKDFATETTLQQIESHAAYLQTISEDLTDLLDATTLSVVDQIDSTPLLDTSSSNIPASASSPLQIVASTAAAVNRLVSVEDIGEFIGVYTGAPASEVLLCVLPLGGGEIQANIPAGTRVSLRNMKNSAITSGFIAINFVG